MQSVRRGLALAMRPRAPLAVLTRAGGAYRSFPTLFFSEFVVLIIRNYVVIIGLC